MAPLTITDRFPSLDLDEVVARVRSFDDDGAETKSDTICRLVEAYAFLSYRWGGDLRYRRARRITGEPRPTNVSGLIWRDDVPAPIGRANAAGFRVLYLADQRDTALSEIRYGGDQVVVTEFRIRAGRSALVTPVGETAQVQRTGRGILRLEAAAAMRQGASRSSTRPSRVLVRSRTCSSPTTGGGPGRSTSRTGKRSSTANPLRRRRISRRRQAMTP